VDAGVRWLDGDRVASLYDFALTVTRARPSAVAAVEAGIAAARSPRPTEIYAEILAAALARAGSDPAPVILPAGEAVPTDDELRQLAWEAAGAVDPRDRAIVDLAGRQGLEGRALAVVLGAAPGGTSAEVAASRARVEHLVGGLLLARVAPLACPEAAKIVAELPSPPPAVPLAGAMAEHAESCDLCADRRRALVPATALLASVERAVLPAELAGRTFQTAGRPRIAARIPRAATVALLAGGLVLAGAAVAVARVSRTPPHRPARAGALQLETRTIDFTTRSTTASVVLRNDGPGPLPYRVRPDAAWLRADPRVGVIPARASQRVLVTFDPAAAPEGDDRSLVRIDARGTSRVVEVTAIVERPPLIGALDATPAALVRSGCVGTATSALSAPVAEESGLSSAAAHWRPAGTRGGADHTVALTAGHDRYIGQLGPFDDAGPVTWWVEAVDTRGNHSRSPDQTLTVSNC
jgi:hypothetical protein